MLKVLDLFSGIGGFSLGLERTGGFKTVAFCEIEEYPQKVLRKHWPEVPIYDDVRLLTADRLQSDGITGVSVLTAGYPCQPFSVAGNRRGAADDRHLWPEVARLVQEIWPDWCIFENVSGHISMGLDEVLSDVEGLGYSWEAFVIPACAVNAIHRRDRVWIIANPGSAGLPFRISEQGIFRFPHESFERKAASMPLPKIARTTTEPTVRRGDDGVSGRVDRLKGLGNAVVPQIPEIIGQAILQAKKSPVGAGLILDQGNDLA